MRVNMKFFFLLFHLHFSLHILWHSQDGWPSASFFSLQSFGLQYATHANCLLKLEIYSPRYYFLQSEVTYCMLCFCIYSHHFKYMSKYLEQLDVIKLQNMGFHILFTSWKILTVFVLKCVCR